MPDNTSTLSDKNVDAALALIGDGIGSGTNPRTFMADLFRSLPRTDVITRATNIPARSLRGARVLGFTMDECSFITPGKPRTRRKKP
jgi:hypothetical protein